MSLTTWPDPIPETLAILRAAATDGGPLAGMTFGTTDPDPTVDGGPPVPYGRVSVDYQYTTERVLMTANMRVVVWGSDAPSTARYAGLCYAVLIAHRGSATVHSIGELTAPLPALDPATNDPICSITVAVRLRPQPI